MKNFFRQRKTAFIPVFIIILLLPFRLIAQDKLLQNCVIKATGTGKTTGSVVAMSIYNPTDKEIKGLLGPYCIPSDGQYQPYIVPEIKLVTVPSHGTVDVKLYGFCTDITKPAATEKDELKPAEWIMIDPTVGQDVSLRTVPMPETNPRATAPFLLKALIDIGDKYDQLKNEGKITTPFSGNPEKEREAIIQQTFWIYTSELRQKAYTKEQFGTRTYEQYEEKTNIKPITLPTDKKQQLDKGIDDFWNTFQAVGKEAKVLETKPEEKPFTPQISGPEVKPCDCGECRLVEGQRIQVYLDRNGERLEGDSIPWCNDQVFIDRPEVLSTCTPEECPPTRVFDIRYTITYKDKQYSAPPSAWQKYGYSLVSAPKMEHQGEMLIEFRYKCFCAGKFCASETITRRLYFIEKNNCCDSIRTKNNGQLKFNINGGSVSISGNKLTVNVPPNSPESFDFDFNLEAIFCNLTDDLVFSELLKLMESKTSGGKTTEFHSSRSVGMGGPSTDPGMSRYYGFGFSKNVNDHEISVFFSVDEKTCSFDVSVFIDDKIYEFSAPPYLSPAQLMTMSNTLGYPFSNQTWTNAMLILSHLSRAHQYKQDAKYMTALRNFLGMLSTKANGLMQTTNNQQLKNDLKTLIDAIPDAIAHGDFNALHDIADKMMPILNATN
ncbi:MAG: hypothetical protein HZB42_14420 [Sphingobacteriales bacterium]|nr:hypothetical protein [Sphingobacteriales bacterium]